MKSAPASKSAPVAAQPTLAEDTTASNAVRARAFLVGIPLLSGLCVLSVYADMVTRVVQFGVLQMAPPVVVALLCLVLINRGLLRLTKRAWLNRGELVVIYSMLLVGAMVSTRGLMEKLIPALVYLPYYATRENRYNEMLTAHLPAWAVPFTPGAANTPVASDYFEGNGAVPWGAWIGPLFAWFALIGCAMLVFLCLATLLRRQWMDNEQLRFPLTALPLALIRDRSDGAPFLANRMMWIGFALSFCVFGINGLHANFSEWPQLVTNFNLGDMFSERPWTSMGYMALFTSLAAVGIAYFLPLDLLFSLWFFYLLAHLQDVGATQMGFIPTPEWTRYQAVGGYIALALAQARIGWPYYKQVWQTAFGRAKPLDDSNELMSYRAAILGLVAGFVGIVIWLMLAGMNPILAAAQMGIYLFLVAVILSRGVAEGGLLITEASFVPSQFIDLFYHLPSAGATNLTMVGLTQATFSRDLRGLLLASFLDDQKMAKEVGLHQRTLLKSLVLALVVAFAVASFSFLTLAYSKGALALYDYPTMNSRWMFELAQGKMEGTTPPPGATEYGGFALGLAATAGMAWARTMFSWFPFNPLGYVLAPTWAMTVLWFPCLLAWSLKSTVMRFGGIETFRKLAPLMLGLVLGEFCAAVFWVLGNVLRGWSVPEFPWP